MARKRRWVWWLSVPVGVLVFLVLPWRMCVVIGSSMEPFLHTGDVVILDRLENNQIHRGNLVVFRYGGKVSIKKVHAIPGDRVIEAYFPEGPNSSVVLPAEEWRWRRLIKQHDIVQLLHLRVPPGYIYVLGTGPSSVDSRDFGLVPISSVLGVVKYGPQRQARPEYVGPETVSVPPRIQGRCLCPSTPSIRPHKRA